MKHPINFDLEKLLLDGCKIIKKDSINYKCSQGDFTHILLECPKDYMKEKDKENRPVKFVSVEIFGDESKWFEATYYYDTKRHAIKSWYDNLTDDRISKMRIKENQSA